MTYIAQYAVAIDPAFIQRITIAALAFAETVMVEPDVTPGHTLRVQLALSMLRSPEVFGPLVAKAAVTDPLITLASTDGDLLTRTTAVWNALAGYAP
jgi:hypothetical protein